MKIKKEPDEVIRIRKLLHHWDDGLITLGEFECSLNDGFKKRLFDALKNGEEYGEFMSVCNSAAAPPPVILNLELEIDIGGFWMRPKK